MQDGRRELAGRGGKSTWTDLENDEESIRSNFQNWNFLNLIAESKSLEKTIKRKYLSFFEILIGT